VLLCVGGATNGERKKTTRGLVICAHRERERERIRARISRESGLYLLKNSRDGECKKPRQRRISSPKERERETEKPTETCILSLFFGIAYGGGASSVVGFWCVLRLFFYVVKIFVFFREKIFSTHHSLRTTKGLTHMQKIL
jgi:hypothetical protein